MNINEILDEELGSAPAPKPSAKSTIQQIIDEELPEQEAAPDFSKLANAMMSGVKPQKEQYDPLTAYALPDSLKGRKTTRDPEFQQAVRKTADSVARTASSAADLGMAMLPGAGSMEAGGAGVENPVSAALNLEDARPIPSMAEDIEEGRNLDATFKGLGVAGDVATAGGLTMMATGAGMIPGAFLTAGGVGMKAVSKYGDDIADGLRKLFDMDKEAAMKAAERADEFVDKDLPIGAALNMIKAETKKAKGPVVKPRVSAPKRDLGLFSRAEEAVLNMDIPKDGISGRALMKKLRDDPDVPNDELDFGLGLMIDPDEMLTKEQLDKYMSESFGLNEKIRDTADTHYGPLNRGLEQYRLPDTDDSNYREMTYTVRPVTSGTSNANLRLSDANKIRPQVQQYFATAADQGRNGGLFYKDWFMYFGDVDETDGILETLGRDQLLPRYRGGEGFAAVGFGDNQLDQFRADQAFEAFHIPDNVGEAFTQSDRYYDAIQQIGETEMMWRNAYDRRNPLIVVEGQKKTTTDFVETVLASQNAINRGWQGTAYGSDDYMLGEALQVLEFGGEEVAAAGMNTMKKFELTGTAEALKKLEAIRTQHHSNIRKISNDARKANRKFNRRKEGAPVDVDAQLSKERVRARQEITQLLAQAQADLKRVDGNGAPIFNQMSGEAFGLTRVLDAYQTRNTFVPRNAWRNLVSVKAQQATDTLGQARRYFSDMRIMDGMGDEADLQELDFVFNESYGRREPGVQYLATRHFKDDAVNQFVHARTSDRITTDGKKVLVVEEIQSDMNKLGDDQLSLIQLPFKNKNYQAFAVARLTKQAVDEGYDGVIFLTGAEQARRNQNGVESIIGSVQSTEVGPPDGMIPPAGGETPIVKQINIINPDGDNIFDGLVDAETGRYLSLIHI